MVHLERINADRDAYIVVNFAHGNDYLRNIGEQHFWKRQKSSVMIPKIRIIPQPPGGSELSLSRVHGSPGSADETPGI
jgi:hypothetical protein